MEIKIGVDPGSTLGSSMFPVEKGALECPRKGRAWTGRPESELRTGQPTPVPNTSWLCDLESHLGYPSGDG
jgi:hypothetical protein